MGLLNSHPRLVSLPSFVESVSDMESTEFPVSLMSADLNRLAVSSFCSFCMILAMTYTTTRGLVQVVNFTLVVLALNSRVSAALMKNIFLLIEMGRTVCYEMPS